MTSSDHLETLAQTLEATGDYRVIRRLKPRPRTVPPPGTPLRLGLVMLLTTVAAYWIALALTRKRFRA